jgi:hypothetical protein
MILNLNLNLFVLSYGIFILYLHYYNVYIVNKYS